MPKVSEALASFLRARATNANQDLVGRWGIHMETQMNVAPGDGEPVAGKRTTWSDGIDEWFNIRVPRNAATEPTWQDYELRFPLDLHADGIGMTGWDWQLHRSRWVAFDFDNLTSHAKGVGVSDADLEKVRMAAEALPYVEVRRSTGGGGIHLYVYFDAEGVPTDNHTEHAALARCVLGMMSSDCNFDFASQIDCCGGVMWVWHRKMGAENQGLARIKETTKVLAVADLPANWRDHIEVVKRRRTKVRINEVSEDQQDPFEALASSRKMIPLDDSHKAQIEELQRSNFTTLWVADHHLLQTHTCALQKLMEVKELGLVGIFKTISEGRNPGTPNCFLFPLDNRAWKVYRFSPGVSEAETWTQDGNGWTTCYFNRLPDLRQASIAEGGIEDPDNGGYVFTDGEAAIRVAKSLGQDLKINEKLSSRQVTLKAHKDGRLVVQIAHEDGDPELSGWLEKKGKLVRVFNTKTEQQSDDLGFNEYDGVIRAITTPAKQFAGWAIHQDGEWINHPNNNIKVRLMNLGNSKTEAECIMGGIIGRAWRLVCLPFQDEYPGGRQWNADAPQFRFKPAELGDDEVPHHPHWDKIFDHFFQELTVPLRDLAWAKEAGMKTGADYGRAWVANALRYPFSQLPYLFAWGPENSGKSIFHEALQELVTKGVVKADKALTSHNDFNGELAGAVICAVEEKDISKSPGAHAKVKEYTTGLTISIRKMRTDAYEQPNTTHWVQTANNQENCLVPKRDTRIVVLHVPDLVPGEEIGKDLLREKLREEAPYFLYTLLNLPLPTATTRLRLPVVATASKRQLEEASCSALERFLDECCETRMDGKIPFKDFYDRFYNWLEPNEKHIWTRQKVSRDIPAPYALVHGHNHKRLLANLAFKDLED